MRPFGGTVANKSASLKLREAIEKLQENVWSGRKGTMPFCQLGCKTKLPSHVQSGLCNAKSMGVKKKGREGTRLHMSTFPPNPTTKGCRVNYNVYWTWYNHNKKEGYMCRALLSEELDLIVQFACFFLLFLSSHSRDKVDPAEDNPKKKRTWP